jgi:hypothetical protein
VYISLGYAAALRHVTCDSEKAAILSRETGGLNAQEINLVIKFFETLSLSAAEVLNVAEKEKKAMRGNVV